MNSLFSTWLPICKGDLRCLTNFIQGQDILLDLHSDHEHFKRTEGAPPLRTIIAWWRIAEGILPTKNLHTVTSGQSIPLWVSTDQGQLDGCCTHHDYFQNWEVFRKHHLLVCHSAPETLLIIKMSVAGYTYLLIPGFSYQSLPVLGLSSCVWAKC